MQAGEAGRAMGWAKRTGDGPGDGRAMGWHLLRSSHMRVLSPCRAILCGLSLGLASLTSPAQTLLVVNQTDSTVSFVDAATAKQVAVMAEKMPGVHGHEIAVSADGRTAYLPIYGDTGIGQAGIDGRTMLVIDVRSRKQTGRVDFGHGVRPHLPVLDPASGLLYVTTELDKSVTIIDPKTLKIVGAVPTGQAQSHMLALSHDGRRGYTANVGPGTVSVLDMAGRKTLAVIPVAGKVQRISISADDRLVFTADQTRPRLAVIDTATNKVTRWIALPGLGYGTASTRDGRWLLVAVPAKNQIAVVDLKTMRVTRSIQVPASPQNVLMRPDGKMAYVACMAADAVAAIALKDWTVRAVIAVGKDDDGLAWAQ
jgi:DNA-binding beta-propeller fold protein YncE